MKAIRFHEYGDPEVLRSTRSTSPLPARDRCGCASPPRRSTASTATSGPGACRARCPWTCHTSPASTWPGPSTRSATVSTPCGSTTLSSGSCRSATTAPRPSTCWPPAANLAPAPTSIPLADAAALPLVGLTAWQALFEHAEPAGGAADPRQRRQRSRRRLRRTAGQVGRCPRHRHGDPPHPRAGPTQGADEIVDHTADDVSAAVTRAGRRAAQPRPDQPRRSSPPWPASSATAGSSSTPPCGCPPRPTRTRGVRGIDLFVRSDARQLAELAARVDRGSSPSTSPSASR